MRAYQVTINDQVYTIELRPENGSSLWTCRLGDREFQVDCVESGAGVLSLLVGDQSFEVQREDGGSGSEVKVLFNGRSYHGEVVDVRALRGRRGHGVGASGPKQLTSPMPGKIVRVLASEGMEVAAGAGVVVIEAMKMQNEIKTPKAGVVRKILAAVGAAVNSGDVVAIVE